MDPREQKEIDMKMIDLDGTDNKGKLGAGLLFSPVVSRWGWPRALSTRDITIGLAWHRAESTRSGAMVDGCMQAPVCTRLQTDPTNHPAPWLAPRGAGSDMLQNIRRNWWQARSEPATGCSICDIHAGLCRECVGP